MLPMDRLLTPCRLGIAMVTLLVAAGCGSSLATEDEKMSRARAAMIEEIERDVRRTAGYLGKDALDPRVMAAMERVERHRFVAGAQRGQAYLNQPLPIGEGQTISQPYIVALMTDLAEVGPADRVLEIGTGSGYQAAVLAELVRRVYTIEIVEPLGREARERFQRLGYDNIETRIGDGGGGWPEAAPFDAIVVTAACPDVPQPLVDQLAIGGRLVLPLASGAYGEELTVITKRRDGSFERRSVLPVRFVPLTGEHGRP